MIFLDDMKTYLERLELGVPFFVGNLPPAPTNCIALFEYQGLLPEMNAAETPGLQLLLRVEPENFARGYEQLYTAAQALMEIGRRDGELSRGIEINGSLYLLVYTPGSGFNQLGKDDNGNPLLSKNFYVVKGGK